MELSTGTNGGELCTSCGLCCDGMLHETLKLSAEEVAWAEARGAVVDHTASGEPCLNLPCEFLRGTICSVYAERPGRCRAYRCGLLDRYEAGTVTFDAARALVSEGRRLLDDAKAALAPGQTLRQAKSGWRANDGAIPPNVSDMATLERHLRLTALQVFADRHFRSDFEEPLVKTK